MKVALISPPYPLEEYPSPPLGISYVAAVLENIGCEVEIWDFIVQKFSRENLEKLISRFNPHVVGATSVTMNFLKAQKMLKWTKEIEPNIITMMGGPHVSFDIKNTLTLYPHIDLIVVGEGEWTLKELIPSIKNREKWKDIKGIAYRDENGNVRINTKRELLQDLSQLPLPARHLLPLSKYLALGFPVSITTSRGCPNRCIFCQGRRLLGLKPRYRPVEDVVSEIEYLVSLGFYRINFADDFFTSKRERVIEICKGIKNRRLKFSWSAFVRADSIDRELLYVMKDAGCDTVSFGVESGNEEMLKRIKKRIKITQVKEAAKMCIDVGMRCLASFIVGLPGESVETLKDTERLAEELGDMGIEYGYHFLAPFPGTTIREQIDSYDLKILSNNWDHYDANRPIVATSNLGPEDMENFVKRYEEKLNKLRRLTEKKYKNGTLTPVEKFHFEGMMRTEVIFELLKNDLIENFSFVDLEGDPLDGIIKKITRFLNKDYLFVKNILKDLYNKGYLAFTKTPHGYKWMWSPNKNLIKGSSD